MRTRFKTRNLQQIPSRGAFAKYIKRLLITDVGKLLIKVDFSAHEVRGWSIISGDTKVAEVFEKGAALRRRFRLVPDPYIAKRLEYEGDVHKMNASFFFGIDILDVVKAIRDAVKTVVFGLIYQQGDAGLAESTGRDISEIGDIKQQFLSRFPVGYQWFEKIKSFAKKHFYVESPIGRRRTLFSLLMSDQHMGAKPVLRKSERQSVNSPVQGLGSDFMMTAIRLMERECFQYWLDNDVYPDIQFCISVHDSVSVHVGYRWFWFATDLIERNMSRGAATLFMERHNMELTSMPEIDFEVGSAESNTESWNWDYKSMRELVVNALVFKRDELKQKVDVEKVADQIMEDQYDMMPVWVQKQLWANGVKIRSMGKTNPLTQEERKLVRKYKSELETNAEELSKICAKEEAAKAARAA